MRWFKAPVTSVARVRISHLSFIKKSGHIVDVIQEVTEIFPVFCHENSETAKDRPTGSISVISR